MKYDEKEITVTYELINGKKVPIYKIPTGMSGESKSKVLDEMNENEEDFDTDTTNPSLYDEENTFLSTDEFIEL